MLPPAPPARSARTVPPSARQPVGRRWRLVGAVAAGALVLVGCGAGGGSTEGGSHGQAEVTLQHVHGLGVDPGDGVLYAGTHHGLVRISPDGELARVADRVQDFMGFTVVGPQHFLASGHPGEGQSGPGNLGLIESSDGGQTWTTLSLEGEADFHALDAAEGAIYGYSGGRLLVSEDGIDWSDRGSVRIGDLAVDPSNSERVLVTTEGGLALSEDAGKSFDLVPEAPFLLLVDISADGGLAVGVSPEGAVHVSTNGGLTWEERGHVGGAPAALTVDDGQVFVAVDGAIVSSSDDGATFSDLYRAE
jgi:hypothetical protein